MSRISWMLMVALTINCTCLAASSLWAQPPGYSARIDQQGRELKWEHSKLEKQRVDLLVRIDALRTAYSRLEESAKSGKTSGAALDRAKERISAAASQVIRDGNRYSDDRKAYNERLENYNTRMRPYRR